MRLSSKPWFSLQMWISPSLCCSTRNTELSKSWGNAWSLTKMGNWRRAGHVSWFQIPFPVRYAPFTFENPSACIFFKILISLHRDMQMSTWVIFIYFSFIWKCKQILHSWNTSHVIKVYLFCRNLSNLSPTRETPTNTWVEKIYEFLWGRTNVRIRRR